MANTATLELTVEGMHCGSCALLIDDALADLPGVLTSATSTKTRASTVTHDNRTNPQQIITTIEALGYHASPTTI
ncbi:MAG: copper chaperone [Pseudonocardiales bacterium]|jgi:copper chaperone|nr:copper chaperone [Pseudonocardiales bacterium]MDT7563125.1 copper chaperone [Pseudonocardiales bacterium]MDT7628106.1 copper chaperone [Pseudonocardiales bacterium]